MSDLTKKTCKELREIAKGYGITGRWEMNKCELIESIEYAARKSNKGSNEKANCNIKKEDSIKAEGSQKVTKTTIEYLSNAEPGTLVAFKRNSLKDVAMSGKFVSIDEKGKVTVESKKGTLFKLSPENIIWVKTGDRWPKWVFNLFNNSSKEVESDNAVS